MSLSQTLLAWYDQSARNLPWRIPPHSDQVPDPYAIWLSEIMLQQTQVTTVIDYFLKFIKKWPSVFDLAEADEDAVMHAWAGLGYYSRARNLHACAKEIVSEYGGVFPQEEILLQKLPGIGPYTSAAIAAIAFNQKANVMDGNIERVMSRILAFEGKLPQEKKKLLGEIEGWMDEARPGDYAQALMDLGARICVPKNPACDLCPIQTFCQAYKAGSSNAYPKKQKRKKIPHKLGYVYVIENAKGEVAIEKREETSMLRGLYGFPTSEWLEEERGKHLDLGDMEMKSLGEIDHLFTHFKLNLEVMHVRAENGFDFVPKTRLIEYGFSKLMQKIFKLIME